jgi:hypothetical protein
MSLRLYEAAVHVLYFKMAWHSKNWCTRQEINEIDYFLSLIFVLLGRDYPNRTDRFLLWLECINLSSTTTDNSHNFIYLI